MGLFDKPIVNCGVCNREIGKTEKRWKTKDGYMCAECVSPFLIHGPRAFIGNSAEELKVMRKDEVVAREFWANNKKEYDELNPSRSIEDILFIDDVKKKWYIKRVEDGKFTFYLDENRRYPPVFKFTDISEISMSLGDKTITSTSVTRKDKGIRKVVVGGVIGGATGAIVGGMMARGKTNTQIVEVQSYFVNVLINGTESPISILVGNERSAKEIHNAFLSMIPNNVIGKEIKPGSETSNADELRKFKGLLDDGIINKEEFEAKKKQILGL